MHEKEQSIFLKEDTRLPPYLPLPHSLLSRNISMTAKVLYAILLNRATLSQKNGWCDSQGQIYIFYPLEEMALSLNRGITAVKNAVKELVKENLLFQKRQGYGRPNILYIRIPIGTVSDEVTDRKMSDTESYSRPLYSQDSAFQSVTKRTPNNYTKTNKRKKRIDYSYTEEDSL